jgi:hypothetical protein
MNVRYAAAMLLECVRPEMNIPAGLRYTTEIIFGSNFMLSAEKEPVFGSENSVYTAKKRQVLPETAQTYILSANLLRQLQ